MPDTLTLRVRNALDAIQPASQAAEAWLRERGSPPDAGYFVSLAIEELVTNSIKYGYDDAAEHLIEIVLSIMQRVLTVQFVDDGRAFDPSLVPAPDLTQPLEDRPVGGLGIHLLRELTDSMSYERRDGANRLTLTKRFG
jgi:anti-sigma regulatory factor (Ser/Thr protein kinase)